MKVVFITSITPSGHYSQYITSGLARQKDVELIVYAGIHEKGKVNGTKYGTMKYVWKQSPAYISDILRELKKDKPDVVHVQQEFNMYGGSLTAALFPILLLLLKINGFKVIVTIHAAVRKRQIDAEFIRLFHKNSKFMKPIFLKMFFQYVYKGSSMFADKLFIHTHLKKKILIEDYGVSPSKLTIVPIVIPEKKINNSKKEKYFFYFGYMVRRKGLEYALEGFNKYTAAHPESSYKLILAGGVIKGQEKAFDEIKEFIKSNHLAKKVIIKGFIEESQEDTLYSKAYAVIIPARVSMGSSGPLFHAMSYGKCCICTREGYFIEDIQHLKSGILTENNRWEKAFEYTVDHPHTVKTIEKNVAKRANSQSPVNVARIYAYHYKSLVQ